MAGEEIDFQCLEAVEKYYCFFEAAAGVVESISWAPHVQQV
jgi:hypothetical protein